MANITKKDVIKSAIQVHGAGEMVSATFAISVIEQLEAEKTELENKLDEAYELLSEVRKCGDYGSAVDCKITQLIA